MKWLFWVLSAVTAASVAMGYDAVVTNLLLAALFGSSLLDARPVVLRLAKLTMGEERSARPDVQDYMRLLTGIWAAYFTLKAMIYLYVGYFYPPEQAVAFRSMFGGLSLVAMLLGERLLRPQLFPLLRRWGYLAVVAPLT